MTLGVGKHQGDYFAEGAMTKRLVWRAAWVGIAACVVALAFGLTCRLLRPAPGIMETKSHSVRGGMTLKDTLDLLGAPNRLRIFCSASPIVGHWSGPDGTIKVTFLCRNGPALFAQAESVCFERKDEPKSFWRTVRTSLGW
jgi:hypothetical protein